jgi:hypothetical protein
MSVKNRIIPSALGRRAISRFVVCAVAVGAAVFGLPSASWAEAGYFDWCYRTNVSCQTGVEISGTPWGDGVTYCDADSYYDTMVCIKTDGDIVYVYDGATDNNSAVGNIYIPESGSDSVASRWCRNPYGKGSWAKCNFNWLEDKEKEVHGGVRYDSDSYWDELLFTFHDV